jgi:hypothetical protein
MVVEQWVEVHAAEASAFGNSGVILESPISVFGTKGATLALASTVGSSVVA